MASRILNPYESSTFGNSLSLRVDGAIGAMSLSPNGRDAVLAGRRGLFIIDLDDPFTPPRWLHHITSWEVADVQWSPHHFTKPSWCISTSNQKALLWDLKRPSSNAIASILHSHNRAISDINFHPFDPEILATCAVDSFIMSWDMRAPRKPVAKWAQWRAGASQVKWNHENPNEIASCHDNSFYIWDTRKGALPVVKIEKAHEKKINGIDFTQGLKNIVTCSNDNKVKFWNLESDEASNYISNFNYFDSARDSMIHPSVVIETDFPIARARSLPFGTDKACGIMPLAGGNDSIHIVNYDDAYRDYLSEKTTQKLSSKPVYSFKGHRGPIKDFLWRTRHEAYEGFDSKRKWKDYQLVTWSSKDFDLKLWQHDDAIYKGVNYDPTFHNVFKDESDSEISRPETPQENQIYKYDTFCCEPRITIDDITKTNGGDLLSAMTLSLIAEKHKLASTEFTQLNHLNWISGVRMGHNDSAERKNSSSSFEDDGPSNLGEEVSIVGHKFPKIRFEKISVSTGELVISLRGPLPALESTGMDRKDSTESNENNNAESAVSLRDKSIVSEGDKETEKMSQKERESLHTESNTETSKEEFTADQKLVFIRVEIDFPKAYPFLELVSSEQFKSAKKFSKLQKQNQIKFNVEETHELSASMKALMQENLENIAQFYSNKYQRFCLEHCLRYLMGEKVELDDDAMMDRNQNGSDSGDGEVIQEVGDEAWVDDLINQQPDIPTYSSGEEEEAETGLADLIPAHDKSLYQTTDSEVKDEETHLNRVGGKVPTVDSTPLPNGCGAIWSPTGQLVCFFIPKSKTDGDTQEDGDGKAFQKFNIFKFTDGGFSSSHHQKSDSVGSEYGTNDDDNSDNSSEDDNENRSIKSSSSSSSDDSFAKDWDEMLSNDAPRVRVQGLFKTSLGLGNYYDHESSHKSSLNRLTSNGGTASNYKSSLKGERKRLNDETQSRRKNVVGIFDFGHLLPDKYELAREYRVLGDSPEILAKYNAAVAFKYGLKEISDVWKILEMILIKQIHYADNTEEFYPNYGLNTPLQTGFGDQMLNKSRFYWNTHPFGSTWLIKEIFDYFEKKLNVQMLAMMSCILYENPKNFKPTSELMNVPIHTPYQVLPLPPTVSITARNSTVYGSSHGKATTRDDIGFEHRNSALSGTRKELSAPPASVYARSISSSVGGESIANGSPDKFRVLKKNFALKSHSLGPSNNSHSSLNDSLNESNASTPDRNMRISSSEKKNKGIILRKPYPLKKFRPKPAPIVSIEMQNIEELDVYEDINSQPLLGSIDKDKLVRYREIYAEMLYNWQLPVGRIKLLKFNYPEQDRTGSTSTDIHKCSIGFKKRSQQHPHQNLLNPITTIYSKLPNSWNTSKRQVLKYCNLCQLAVTKNFTLCTVCEHIMHTACAREWWTTDNHECASGCGCRCLERSF
ncbi:WD repeat protein, putative [Candida dubliniensis CD36]|uniref:WD repeat protein, putative n=1 Tax=Candida dubliniensis (strain CD36 / ATCC MYA-646 / CBS 7987 / NCPF 3949 / NRRL Y-17841) TaxID=573826 RepID=B9WKU8_CANDC|nr:WD repeat protein, putative [Candida dubliniensis CD36]CAX39648.1 WD repeat protein, putative [Candida dubliniensis CD36]